jgi:FkbM family methyltransferase
MSDTLLQAAIASTMRLGRACPIVVDVGAYDGWHSLRIREAFNGNTTNILIEPERPSPMQGLDRWHWHQCVAADANGETVWNISDQAHPGSGSALPPVPNIGDIYPGMSFTPGTRPMQRLDTLLRLHGIDAIDLLWMDVQGAESIVLRGLGELVTRTAIIATEVHAGEYIGAPTAEQIVAALPTHKLVSAIDAGHLILELKP